MIHPRDEIVPDHVVHYTEHRVRLVSDAKFRKALPRRDLQEVLEV